MPGLLQLSPENTLQQNFEDVTPDRLPLGFPQRIGTESDLVWSGEDMKDESKYTYYFTDTDKEEIDAALKYFLGQAHPIISP